MGFMIGEKVHLIHDSPFVIVVVGGCTVKVDWELESRMRRRPLNCGVHGIRMKKLLDLLVMDIIVVIVLK